MTKTEAASVFGQRLIHQILATSHDGDISLEEVFALRSLLSEGPDQMPAVRFLRGKVAAVLANGALEQAEVHALRLAMERVVPKDVRARVTELLSSIGLPSSFEVREGSGGWREDPMTERQRDFIVKLSGEPPPEMTKGDASDLIEDLLERRPATTRQRMLLRFFDREEMADRPLEEISQFIDELFYTNDAYESAWLRFKASVGDDRTVNDLNDVPKGGYRQFLRGPPLVSPPRWSRGGVWLYSGIAAFIIVVVIAAWIASG